MTTLDPLTEPLVRLFLRIDAAHPTDAALRLASDFWQEKRAGRIAPGEDDLVDLRPELLPHAFLARLTTNGTRHWMVTGAGSVAAAVMKTDSGDMVEKKIAVRLRRLFDIVAEKAEPYSAMFEIEGEAGQRQVVEVYAAPLSDGRKDIHAIFAALNGRVEAGA